MEKLKIDKAFVSVTSNGATILNGEEGQKLARSLNEFCKNFKESDAEKFFAFASLPNLFDNEGCMKEMTYALDSLHLDGVVLYTSYFDGAKTCYLGDDRLFYIWEEIAKRNCLVFIHPIPGSENRSYGKGVVPCPIIDFPQETTRTATDIVFSGIFREFPSLRVILSHAGGTLPMIAERIALAGTGGFGSPLSEEDVLHDFRLFYYDIAVTFSDASLDALLQFADHKRIVYGSDVPYMPLPLAERALNRVRLYFERKGLLQIFEDILYNNSYDLLSQEEEIPMKVKKPRI